MKARKSLTLLLAALTLTACDYDDSALWEQVNQNTEDINQNTEDIAAQAERIAALEAWQAETNTNIQSLQTLLSTTDYITAVTPAMENGAEVGYTITFLHSDPVIIYHGQKGDTGDKGDKGDKGDTGDTGATGAAGATPQIGVTQGEGGNWYWTLNGTTLTDTEGKPIRVNGEKGEQGDKGDTGATGPQGPQGPQGDKGEAGAPVPQISTGSRLTTQGVTQDADGNAIAADAIYLSVDDGKMWYRVSGEDGEDGEKGEKGEQGDTGATGATGDSFFQSVDTSEGDSFFQSVDTSDPTCVTFTLKNSDDTTTSFSVPRYTGIKLTFTTVEDVQRIDYGTTKAISFTAEGSDQFTTDNLFTVAPDGWKAEVALTTRALSTDFILNVTAPAEARLNAGTAAIEGEILVMLDNRQGSTTIGRLKVAVNKYTIDGTTLTAGVLQAGELAAAIGNRTDLTSVTVKGGTLNKADWEAIKQSRGSLVTIDLEGATYTGVDKDNWVGGMGSNHKLTTIKLPQGITALGKNAFSGCTVLNTVTLPETLTIIWDEAFSGCTVLNTVTLPEELTSIKYRAFYNCHGLESITLPDKVAKIEDYAFFNCDGLESVTCKAPSPPTLGIYAFPNLLKAIYVPARLVMTYKTFLNWRDYADKIQAIP